MALRVFSVLALLLFCSDTVLSDSKIDENVHNMSQGLNVFTKGANRNSLRETVIKLSKGHSFALVSVPTPVSNLASIPILAPAPLPTPALPPAPLPTPAPFPAPKTGTLDCGGLCKQRCRLNSRPKVCLRACGTCCMRCKCVPPGTYGNKEVCGKCYTDMRTHGNKPKCP